LLDSILYVITKGASVLFAALPVRFVLSVGRAFGRLAYFLNYKRSRVAYANIRYAFAGRKDSHEVREIVRSLYCNFGEVLAEVLRMPAVDKRYKEKFIDIENLHYIEQALKRRKGLIFLTGHFGNWELLSVTSALQGYPLLVLAREQKMKRLNDALNEARESKGCRVIKKGMQTRQIYDHLKANGIVGILSDQDAGKAAPMTDFFGRPTSTPKGAFTLARRTGASIIPAFMIRKNGPHHRLALEEPIEVGGEGTDEVYAMKKFTRELEKKIREHPEQWLWLHKRWKSSPLRRIAVLNDGRAGHLNQARAITEIIKEIRAAAGAQEADTKTEVIEIEYRSGARRALMSLASNITCASPVLRNMLLRFALTKASYSRIKEVYADIVVSCGSKTAACNLLLARENNAKNIAVMKPALVGPGNFTLMVMPEHDRPAARDNIIVTSGAPNMVNPAALEDDIRRLKNAVGWSPAPKIGLLLGGDNRYFSIEVAAVKEVIKGIKEIAEETGAEVLVTTSRRTGPDIERLVKDEFADYGLKRLLVIANDRNEKWAVGGMFAACKTVVVSGESNSMVSEAASSPCHVVVFTPKKISRRAKVKHELFLEGLSRDGYIRVTAPEGVGGAVAETLVCGEEPRILDERSILRKGLMRVI